MNQPKIIGINGWGLDPGKTGGTETYFRNLIQALQACDTQNQYIIFLKTSSLSEIRVQKKNFRVVELKHENFFDKCLKRLHKYLPLITPRQGRTINSYNLDVCHFPFQVIAPLGVKSKKVLTFHDMQEVFFPHFFTKSELTSREWEHKMSAKVADSIITISQFSKNSLIQHYGIRDEKISVVYHGFDSKRFNLRSKFVSPGVSLPEKYIFYPAASWPHKNHLRLLEAFLDVSKDYPELKLVLSGMKTTHYSSIEEFIRKNNMQDRVIHLGYLPYNSLPEVYNKALFMIFPSLFEGFGIPVLEAMAMGTPVLCSNTASLPEIAEKSALFLDPRNPQDISKKMRALLESARLCNDLRRHGLEHVKTFSWERMALDTQKVYMRVIDEK